MTRDAKRHWRAAAARSLGVLATLTLIAPAAFAGNTNTISSVDVVEEADRTVITIVGSRKPTFTVFKLSNPQRLFIDIVDGDVAGLQPQLSVDNGVISKVAAVPYKSGSRAIGRLIVGFDKTASYDVKSVGSTLVVHIDGAERKRADLRLRAAKQEAVRVERELAHERKLLAQLKSARVAEDKLREQARLARAQEEQLRAKIEGARRDAERLVGASRAQADRLTAKLEQLRQANQLAGGQREALARAMAAERDRQAAARDAATKSTALAAAAKRSEIQDRARLAAARAAAEREKDERAAAQSALSAARARDELTRKIASARASGQDAGPATAELDKQTAKLQRAQSAHATARKALAEARLAEAQADAGLKGAVADRLTLEKARRAALELALNKEKERADALRTALTEKGEAVKSEQLAMASTKAQQHLAQLEQQLSTRRAAVERYQEAAGVEQARVKLLKGQIDNEREKLASMRSEREQEEAKLATAKAELARTEARTEAKVAEAKVAEAKAAEAKAAEAKVAEVEAPAPAPVAAAAASEPAGMRPVLRDVTFDDASGDAAVRIKVTGKVSYKVVRHNERRIELKLKNVTIPRKLERSLDTSEFAGPVKLVSSFRSADEPGTVRVVVDLRESATPTIKAEGDEIIWSFASSASPSPGTATPFEGVKTQQQRPGRRMPPGVHSYPGVVGAEGGAVAGKAGGVGASRFLESRRRRKKVKYSGKKINLTIKDADIQHVLTFLAKEGGVNIVASDKVSGEVTFHLENIPWDLALDMILRTQGYDYVKEAGVYRVAPAEDIREEFEAELKKRQTIRDLKPMVVRFVTVNYASLKDVGTHIKTVLSKNGTVSVDQSTSTLIIKDIEEHVQAAEDIVRRLDVQLPQVLIEARIVEATTSFSREVGIQWGGNFTMAPAYGNATGLSFPSTIGISGGADDANAPTGGLLTSNPNFAVNLPAATGLGAGGALGVTLGSLGGSANLNLRLSAAEDEGSVKIISAPKILTIDGKKATIRQGVSIPVPVVSANGVNTQFFDADLKLEVMTNSSPDGNIKMEIDISKNEPDFGQTSANGAPTIQTKEAETTLLVRDGETVVIGGIYTRNTGTSSKKVPFLGDIPILGWFFSNSRDTDNRSELLIFITPRIANRRASVVQSGRPGLR